MMTLNMDMNVSTISLSTLVMTVDLAQEEVHSIFDNCYKPSHLPLIRLCRRWWKTEQKTSWSPQALGGVPSVTTLIGERILLVLKVKI